MGLGLKVGRGEVVGIKVGLRVVLGVGIAVWFSITLIGVFSMVLLPVLSKT